MKSKQRNKIINRIYILVSIIFNVFLNLVVIMIYLDNRNSNTKMVCTGRRDVYIEFLNNCSINITFIWLIVGAIVSLCSFFLYRVLSYYFNNDKKFYRNFEFVPIVWLSTYFTIEIIIGVIEFKYDPFYLIVSTIVILIIIVILSTNKLLKKKI